MATLNNTAFSIVGSAGLFGGGSTSGTGSNAEGYEGEMPDMLSFYYTATSASPAVFTLKHPANNLASNGGSVPVGAYCVNGNQVVLGGSSGGFYNFSATSASPGVFTSAEAGQAGLIANGTPVALYGAAPTGITVSQQAQPYALLSTPTIYYMVASSGNTFELSATVGGSAINTTSAVALSANATMQVLSWQTDGVPTGFSPGVVYYMVSVSGSTFELALTAGGSAVNSTSIGAGFLQIPNNTSDNASSVNYGANQINYGGVNGYRTGALASGVTMMSLDENPQLMWQNVPGATCQLTDSTGIAGSNNNTFPVGAAAGGGWGASGGFVSGQPVYETKAPVESPADRKNRLMLELEGFDGKKTLTKAQSERKSQVEAALKDLK